MNKIAQPDTDNKALAIIRRLAADKREAQRQMRSEFLTNPDIQRAVEELNRRADERTRPND